MHNVRKGHSVCRKNGRILVNEDARDTEHGGHRASVLTTGTAKAGKVMDRRVVTTSLSQSADRSRHGFIRNGQEAQSYFFRGELVPSLGTLLAVDLSSELCELLASDFDVQGLILVRAENFGEILRE